MHQFLHESCDHIGVCPLASDSTGYSPELARIIRQKWCRGDYRSCARFQLAKTLGWETVPVDLFPSETRRAESLLHADTV